MNRSFRLLRLPAVLERRGTSQSSHYSDIQLGLWPPGVKLGARSVAWPESEVDEMLAATVRGATQDELREIVRELLVARNSAHKATRASELALGRGVQCG